MREINRGRDSFLEKYDKIVNLSIKEIEFIRSKYNWNLRLATGLILLTIACVAWILADHISGYKNILDEKFNVILSSMESTQDSINENFVAKTNLEIHNLVAKNFTDKEILKTIQSVASEKVDSFSTQYLDQLIIQNVTPKLDNIFTKLGASDDKIQLIEFYLSKVAAFNDDRISFDKLNEMAKNKNHKYSNEASQIVRALILRYAQKSIPSKHPLLVTTEKDEAFDWSFKQCYESFFAYPKEGRIVLLENVFEIKRFTKDEKTSLALLALKNDESLTVVIIASNFLIREHNLEFQNLEIEKIINSFKTKS